MLRGYPMATAVGDMYWLAGLDTGFLSSGLTEVGASYLLFYARSRTSLLMRVMHSRKWKTSKMSLRTHCRRRRGTPLLSSWPGVWHHGGAGFATGLGRRIQGDLNERGRTKAFDPRVFYFQLGSF